MHILLLFAIFVVILLLAHYYAGGGFFTIPKEVDMDELARLPRLRPGDRVEALQEYIAAEPLSIHCASGCIIEALRYERVMCHSPGVAQQSVGYNEVQAY